MKHAVSGDSTGSFRIAVQVVDDAATMRRTASGIEVKTHRPQYFDHSPCEMRCPQHIATEI
jgi:hypothetical protein